MDSAAEAPLTWLRSRGSLHMTSRTYSVVSHLRFDQLSLVLIICRASLILFEQVETKMRSGEAMMCRDRARAEVKVTWGEGHVSALPQSRWPR